MGLLGSALGRGVAGAAAGGADYLSKYIDNDLQMQKAQALADLQRKTAGAIREDDDAFRNDPTRVSRDRGNKVADITAEGGARNAVALQGKLAEVGSTELTAAQIERDNALLKGTMPAKIEAENAFTAGTAPARIAAERDRVTALAGPNAQAAGLLARASDLNGGERAARTALLQMDLKDKQRLSGLYDSFTAISNDKTKTETEKAEALKPISTAIAAIKAKNGSGTPRDPELDTQTVVEEKLNRDGTTTKTTRKEVRKPGQGGAAGSPYADGTELRGQDGKAYVVKDGQPVLKDGAGLMDRASNEPTRQVPASTERLTRKEWDRRYGKGDFDKSQYAPGEDSMKAF